MCSWRAGMVLGIWIPVTLAMAGGAPTQAVPWAEVRASFAETICVVPLPESPEGYWVSLGDRARCGLAPASAPLERAVETGFKDARVLLVTVPSAYDVIPKGIEAAYAADDAVERNRIARAMFLGQEEFLRPLVPRLVFALSAEGSTCTLDGPSRSGPPSGGIRISLRSTGGSRKGRRALRDDHQRSDVSRIGRR